MNKKLNKKQKRISPNTIAIIATITILIGGFFLFNNYVQAKKEIAYDYISNVFYEDDNLQKIKDGESLGGKSRAEDDFATSDEDDFLE